ncbi:MAG: SPASM domain-containing protein [Bacteriovoracaceae bacterium]|nr:SPASM domain-containing protein [Bacteriovoracaceae bacterium]
MSSSESHLEVLARLRAEGLSDKFCIAPFSTLTVNPDGTVCCCRQKGSDFIIGDLKKQTIDEIWNGEYLQKWRKEFLDGAPVICKKEVDEVRCNLCHDSIQMLPEISLNRVVNTPILKFGANFNGQCNVRCQMCHIWKMPNGFYDQIGFWDIARKEIFPSMLEIDLYAGEPFIQKDTYKLMEEVSSLNPNCLWTISTNLNWTLSSYVKEKLDLISIKNIIVSIDSLVPSCYESIRNGSSFDLVMKTFHDLIEYGEDRVRRGLSPVNLTIINVIQRENARELEDLVLFAEANNVSSFRCFLYEPCEFSILSQEGPDIDSHLDYYFNHFSATTISKSMQIIRPMINCLPSVRKKYFIQKLISVIG